MKNKKSFLFLIKFCLIGIFCLLKTNLWSTPRKDTPREDCTTPPLSPASKRLCLAPLSPQKIGRRRSSAALMPSPVSPQNVARLHVRLGGKVPAFRNTQASPRLFAGAPSFPRKEGARANLLAAFDEAAQDSGAPLAAAEPDHSRPMQQDKPEALNDESNRVGFSSRKRKYSESEDGDTADADAPASKRLCVEQSIERPNLDTLPTEVLQNIIGHLELPDVGSLARVNHALSDRVSSSSIVYENSVLDLDQAQAILATHPHVTFSGPVQIDRSVDLGALAPGVQNIEFLPLGPLESIRGVSHIVKRLTVCNGTIKSGVHLPRLDFLMLWDVVSEDPLSSVLRGAPLRSLFIYKAGQEIDFKDFPALLDSLETLDLEVGVVRNLHLLQKLRKLELRGPVRVSRPSQAMPNLQELVLQHTTCRDFSFVPQVMPNLTRLQIAGSGVEAIGVKTMIDSLSKVHDLTLESISTRERGIVVTHLPLVSLRVLGHRRTFLADGQVLPADSCVLSVG